MGPFINDVAQKSEFFEAPNPFSQRVAQRDIIYERPLRHVTKYALLV